MLNLNWLFLHIKIVLVEKKMVKSIFQASFKLGNNLLCVINASTHSNVYKYPSIQN